MYKAILSFILGSFFLMHDVKAAILNVDATGQLIGAQNVDVSGTFYDVTFVDDTCIALFNGCDRQEDFPFSSAYDAYDAAYSLLSQVFVDSPLGAFDSDPSLTRGISNSNEGMIMIPLQSIYGARGGISVALMSAFNSQFESADSIPLRGINGDELPGPSRTWALFSPAANPVPAPGTLLLVGVGMICLMLKRRTQEKRDEYRS